MTLLESRLTKEDGNPIQERIAVMGTIASSIKSTENDPDLTPNSKSGLLSTLRAEKKTIATDIIAFAKSRSESNN